MSTFDYADLAATATELITEFGRDATIKRKTSGEGYNPGPPTVATYAVKLVEISVRYFDRKGTKIEAGDKGFLLSVSGVPGSFGPADRLVDEGQEWKIEASMPIRPGSTTVVYMILGRR